MIVITTVMVRRRARNKEGGVPQELAKRPRLAGQGVAGHGKARLGAAEQCAALLGWLGMAELCWSEFGRVRLG